MRLLNNGYYVADKGKHFVLTEKGKAECASYHHKTVGKPVEKCDYEVVHWAVDRGYVIEVGIPGWTTLKGYEVVYYSNNYRLHAGNPQVFPTLKAAEVYKKHYESYEWFNDELFIEETEYGGVPLSECKTYNGKEIIDEEHYFGLNACEVGDYFDSNLIDDFKNMLPPASLNSRFFQMGEPSSHMLSNEGNMKETYPTFVRISDNVWKYCGNCFKDSYEEPLSR